MREECSEEEEEGGEKWGRMKKKTKNMSKD
jgi:hypothetical protein